MFCILVFLASPCYADITKTITLSKDMTYDGVPDKLVCKVWGKSWQEPISWSFSVFDSGVEIYRHVRKEDNNIVHFEDPDYVGNCVGLLDCRRKWYSELLFPAMFHTIKFGEARHTDMLAIFLEQAPDFYARRFGLEKDQAKAHAKRLARFLEDRDIVGFALPEAPVYSGPLMTYDKYHREFVWFYSP